MIHAFSRRLGIALAIAAFATSAFASDQAAPRRMASGPADQTATLR